MCCLGTKKWHHATLADKLKKALPAAEFPRVPLILSAGFASAVLANICEKNPGEKSTPTPNENWPYRERCACAGHHLRVFYVYLVIVGRRDRETSKSFHENEFHSKQLRRKREVEMPDVNKINWQKVSIFARWSWIIVVRLHCGDWKWPIAPSSSHRERSSSSHCKNLDRSTAPCKAMNHRAKSTTPIANGEKVCSVSLAGKVSNYRSGGIDLPLVHASIKTIFNCCCRKPVALQPNHLYRLSFRR